MEDLGCSDNLPIGFSDDDMTERYEDVWDNLDWNEETKSYKYKDWEWIVLDI